MHALRLFTLMLALGGSLWLASSGFAKDDEMMSEVKQIRVYSVEKGDYILTDTVVKTEDEWKQQLDPAAYKILRQKGTEAAFSGKYAQHHEYGVYRCAACGQDLFHSDDKYESGTGWPSYYRPVAEENLVTRPDRSFFMVRNELICSRCQSHIGHVFGDGPPPTGKRYCINSAALDFHKLDKK